MNETDDRAIIDTARAALERSAAASQEAYATEPDDERAMRHLVDELQATACATTLANLDPTRPLGRLDSEAVEAGRDALRQEAAGWRLLAAAAVDEPWRAEFEALANEAQWQAYDVDALHQRLSDRHRSADQEAER
jgi:hypothetical protein